MKKFQQLMLVVALLGVPFTAHSEVCSKKCKRYDYIVVGDGAAGSIIARKLSDEIQVKGKCKHPSVLVLERGENQIQQFGYPTNPVILDTKLFSLNAFTDPNSTFSQLSTNPKYAQLYSASINSTTSDPILSNRPDFFFSTGKGWGGGSSHFYMLAYRGTPHNWNDYATINDDISWSYDSLLPIFKSLETYTPNTGGCFDANERGSHGPISIIQTNPDAVVNPQSPTVDPVVEAFATNSTVGVGFACDYNSGSQPPVGTSAMQFFQSTPIDTPFGQYRSWAHNSFLPIGTIINTEGQGLNGRELTIRSNAVVNKVLFKGKKAIGVEFLDTVTGELNQVFAKQIILSAGAFNSPQILQRSGIGDATLLSSLGIPVVFDNPNVGAHMEQHVALTALYATPFPIDVAVVMSDLHNTDLNPGDTFYYPADGIRRVASILFTGVVLGDSDLTGVGPFVNRTNFQGTVDITSNNPLYNPIININTFSDDTTGLVNGSTLNQLMAAAYNIKAVADESGFFLISPPASAFNTPTDLADFLKAAVTFANHATGTCRFGTSAAHAVVDSKLSVFGVKNLKVADLSVYPYTLDGNPMTSALVAAIKCVESLGVPVN